MVVRGAPAIGITAAYGVVLSALSNQHLGHKEASLAIEVDIKTLAKARPTAVNLPWALRRMRKCLQSRVHKWVIAIEQEAINIHNEDIAANKAIGRLGAEYLGERSNVMTHCNAGALATGGYGTALGVIRAAFADNKLRRVFASETRPWFQGSRLTAWELAQEQIPVDLICDSASASALCEHDIDWVIVGADRIAANGDVANKIGTYGLAILARHLGKKFMVAAPTNTIDITSANGSDIEIEVRESNEITRLGDQSMTAANVSAWNPVFDVTPAELVDVLITEKGAIEQPNTQKVAQLLSEKKG